MPLLSVIMPAYNVASYVRDAIASVQAQTLADFELIVIDDGSTDATPAILRELAARDSRLRIVSRPNTGIVGALNDALALASAAYIARMDGDDLCRPHRFERQLSFLQSHPQVLLVGSDVEFMDAAGARLKTYRPPHPAEAVHDALLAGNSGALIHPAVMGPRRSWTDTGGYREQYKFVEDYDLFLRLTQLGPLANLGETLLRYRIHAQSTNYLRRDQQVRLLKELCLAARARENLAGDFDFQPVPPHRDLSSVYREWAWWALEGGEYRTARRYALKSWLKRPWQFAGLRCLLHILRSSSAPSRTRFKVGSVS